MKVNSLLIVIATILVGFSPSSFACTFDGNESFGANLTPTVGYQIQSNVSNGQYFTVNVNCGDTYNFNFCNNGGTASWDTEISILDVTGSTQHAYNDDNCGTRSNLTWIATYTGVIQVLVSRFSCNNTGGSTDATLAYNVISGGPSFTLTENCGGATSTINGTPGGTFAFNPAPSDGSQINTTTGLVTNGTFGTTYHVEYTTPCGSSSTESVTMQTNDCWTLNGDAKWINAGGESCIQLTDEVNSQNGCAWNGTQISFASDFTLTLDYYFGDNISGADGNTFTFQPSSSTVCGEGGQQLGAGGIPNALVVEFDTYDNDNPTHLYDITCDHVAVEVDGSMSNAAPLFGPICAKAGGGNIDDGGLYQVDIEWTEATHTLRVYFDGSLRLTCVYDFVLNTFGGVNDVYWGATSATGALNNKQYFCPSSILILPVTMGEFSSECADKEELFKWTTITEQNTDYFQLEYTYDGMVFYPVDTYDAAGNSQKPIEYSARVSDQDTKQRYYRLKIVDEDGAFEYTDLIASKTCATNSTLIGSTIQNESGLVIGTSETAEIQLINQLGQVLFIGTTENNILTIDKSILKNGIYYILAETSNGIQESGKVMVTK